MAALSICTWLVPFPAFADVAAVVATIERLPRPQRIVAYQSAMVRPGVTDAERVLLTFPRHFCVLTRNPSAHRAATIEQCRKECAILNTTFRTLDDQPLVRFRFKGFSTYADIAASDREFIRFGDSNVPYDSDGVARAFNNCTDPNVRDRQAINFYIYKAP